MAARGQGPDCTEARLQATGHGDGLGTGGTGGF